MKKFAYGLGIFLILIFCAGPLLHLSSIATWADYTKLAQNQNTLLAVQNTLLIALAVGLSCLLLGLPLAWLLTRTDLRFRKTLRSWFCLPYAIPPFVGAIGWIILANPTSGVLNQWLGLNLNIYSYTGLIWVETSFLFTFVLLNALSLLEQMDPSLEEAARLSGAGGLRVFFDIALPMLKPAMLSGFLLSFLATAASFGVPALIGGPARIYLLTTQIYAFQRMGTAQGMQMSIALSVCLALASLILLYSVQSFLGRQNNYSVSGKASRFSCVPLGRWNPVILGVLLLGLLTLLVLPIFGILLSAFSRVQGSWSLANLPANLTLQNYQRVLFATEETGRAIAQSFTLAFGAALVCTLFAFFFNYFVQRTSWPGRKFATIVANIPFSTPGTVLAIAFILSFSHGFFGFDFFSIDLSLYNTLLLIGLVYSVKYLSLSLKTVGDGYQQIHPSLEEAARISGAGWWTLMRTIYWPLLKTSLMASLFLVFMPALCELTMTILLTGPGLETIGSLIFQLQEYSDMAGGGAAVLSSLVVLFVLLLNFSLKFISRGRYGL